MTTTKTTTKTPLPGTLSARAAELAERTNDAYSWDNYGEKGWVSAARELLRRGYTDRQAEAILRSKWTRWAGDMATNRASWRYGRTTGADLGRFLDSMEAVERVRLVNELEVGTFGALDATETLPVDDRLSAETARQLTARPKGWEFPVAPPPIAAGKTTGTLVLHALCPHCDSDITEITATPQTADEGYDNAHFKGRGGYRLQCASCCEVFHIERDTVNDVQHLALRLLGEA